MDFDLEDPFSCTSSNAVADLFAVEMDHMPCREKLHHHLPLRQNALSLLLQLRCSNIDSYLAANYVDRFLSRRDLPNDTPWAGKLLAVACLSLASKMRKTHCRICEIEGKVGVACNEETIARMELLVLSTLQWRMRSVTPFSFFGFFLSLLQLKDPIFLSSLRARATQIIFLSQTEIKLSDHKPSMLAASALFAAARRLFPLQLSSIRCSFLSCHHINEVEMLSCCKLLEEATEMEMDHGCGTPVSVLGCRHRRHCSSSSDSEIAGERSEVHMKKRRTCDCNPQ